MRWDNLRLDEPLETGGGGDLFTAARDRALPLIERGAVARTFDTPGFRGMTFFEVQARSVVNRVPEASRMPFKWTINPYRGCQHACVYCLEGETPILMADGRAKPLAQLRAGDGIYGTVRRDGGREYVRTTVLAHWSTVKPAYRVLLEDGTQLVCSGDHRFLTERGWKYVTAGGLRRRPHLSAGHALMGTGGFAEPPKQTAAYRRGYLCGLIRGDGNAGHYSYPQLDRPADRTFLFRLPLAGQENREGLTRTAGYLARSGIGCVGFSFAEETDTAGYAGRRELTGARTGTRASWPGSSTRTEATGTGSCSWLRPIRRSTAGWCSRWNRWASASPWNGRPGARASGCAAASPRRSGSSTPWTPPLPPDGRSRPSRCRPATASGDRK